MGLFNNLKGKKDTKQKEVSTQDEASPVLIDMLSRYMGVAHQHQLSFGEQVVRNRNWNVDLGQGTICFGEDEYPIQLLGTESLSSNTWLWGFLNPSAFPDSVLKDSQYTYAFCKPVPELAPSQMQLTELVNGHTISSIATAARNDQTCYYRCPYNGGAAYVLVRNIPKSVFLTVDAAQVIHIISELILQYPLNHRTLVKSLMKINCDTIDDTNEMLIGHYANGTELVISFDGQGRINSMNTTLSNS